MKGDKLNNIFSEEGVRVKFVGDGTGIVQINKKDFVGTEVMNERFRECPFKEED